MDSRNVGGRSGIGLVGFAILAIALVVLVATVALAVGRQIGVVEAALEQVSSPAGEPP